MSSRQVRFPVVLFLVGVLVYAGKEYLRNQRGYRELKPAPISVPFSLPSSGVLERQTTLLFEREIPKEATQSIQGSISGQAFSPEISPFTVKEPGVRSGKAESVPQPFGLKLSRFAYIRYGKVGERPLGTFLDNRTRKQFAAKEGDAIEGLRVLSVSREFVVLRSPGGEVLRKPRVDLEVDDRPSDRLSPEEIQSRWTRYNELWGNMARYASQSTEPTEREQNSRLQESPREARRRYLNKLKAYRERSRRSDENWEGPRDPALPTVGEDLAEEGAPVPVEEPVNPQETSRR